MFLLHDLLEIFERIAIQKSMIIKQAEPEGGAYKY